MNSIARWKKIGRIFCPENNYSWMYTHATLPIAKNIGKGKFKIYFSSRDKENRSFTGFVIIDIDDPLQILQLSDKPILSPGRLGAFDDSGAMATWITQDDNNCDFMYYVGWNLGLTVPFRNSIGLATFDSLSLEYKQLYEGPIVDRTNLEPHFVGSCCVLFLKGVWRMWYLSCTEWNIFNGRPQHRYHIKYAESKDGINWIRNGVVSIDYANDSEYALSRPSVIYDDGIWKMWYSYRGSIYKIGYAESNDGVKWIRKDHLAGISKSTEGWDSEMIEYPYVFKYGERLYMLYNGNGYGQSGFGLAILEP